MNRKTFALSSIAAFSRTIIPFKAKSSVVVKSSTVKVNLNSHAKAKNIVRKHYSHALAFHRIFQTSSGAFWVASPIALDLYFPSTSIYDKKWGLNNLTGEIDGEELRQEIISRLNWQLEGFYDVYV